jgi:peptidoglycan hydrolase CwlO-like protein
MKDEKILSLKKQIKSMDSQIPEFYLKLQNNNCKSEDFNSNIQELLEGNYIN